MMPMPPTGDMRPPMYPMAPYVMMPAPPGWYDNRQPVEVSAQEFQDEEAESENAEESKDRLQGS